ncbi:formate dehydrogenase subunit delta [Telmatospirillum siberiense]|uniref:Formate dehydrogenase subunit delta n=1 Tax=Telmatospirillum siberiense TaxID=382514 RepID=A0A2N3PYX3_9PROT|nr:formate dehydrogenase subunit delta [Telmatospirillum siberiense]PKU25600.1 formate dehydrogenase subunit delta [Telmatospirillum siberiense]
MHHQDLIRMANQIAQFFDVYPEEQGVVGIARHLRDFWDPRMRRQLKDYAGQSPEDLAPLARRAVDSLNERELVSTIGLRTGGDK